MKKKMNMVAAAALSMLVWTHQAQAEILDYNHAFSYSELGAEIISYGEKTQVGAGELNLNQSVVNVVQRSGGYTPVSETTGFYVNTATTLDPRTARESWDISPYGVVQTNDRKVRWNELYMMASWLPSDDSGLHYVAGFGMATMAFSRSDFTLTTIGKTLANQEIGSIGEDSTHISANVGVKYDSTFIDPDEESRLQAGFSLGVPVYYRVENSKYSGTAWTEYFKGYDINADVGYGFQIFEKFMLSLHLDAQYKFRPQTSSENVTFKQPDPANLSQLLTYTGSGFIPEATIWNVRTTIGVEWSY